jgi:glycosyltransferase involved in cell wall biosynthesis
VLILTNFEQFPEQWTSASGVAGRSLTLHTPWAFLAHSRRADLVIINSDVRLLLRLTALYWLFPWWRRPILGHDIVLHPPLSFRSRVIQPVARRLLSRVDHFAHCFRILDGYQKYYDIGPDRSSYLPYKANIKDRYQYRVDPEGEYILCLGYSERDYDTFFRAVAHLPYPAAIATPDFLLFREHGSRFSYRLSDLPSNVRQLADDGSSDSMIRLLEWARIVVLPILASSMSASGISLYLNAMLMGKCVIMTTGPGRSDVLTDQAIFVAPEDSQALAAAIQRVWEDRDLLLRTAARGRAYAEACGGGTELRQRALERALEKLRPELVDRVVK